MPVNYHAYFNTTYSEGYFGGELKIYLWAFNENKVEVGSDIKLTAVKNCISSTSCAITYRVGDWHAAWLLSLLPGSGAVIDDQVDRNDPKYLYQFVGLDRIQRL
jgi:hypothetical protein